MSLNKITLYSWDKDYELYNLNIINKLVKSKVLYFPFHSRLGIEVFFNNLEDIDCDYSYICFDSTIYKFLETREEFHKFFILNHNEIEIETTKETIREVLSCVTELFYDLYIEELGKNE